MKFVSKTILFLSFCVVISMQSLVAQQIKFNAIIDIEAMVIKPIEVETINGMRISQLQPGLKEVNINPVNSSGAGHMIAFGNVNADISINYVSSKVVRQTNGPGILRFNYSVSGNTEDNQQTSELIGVDSRNLRFSDRGIFYIWVGGTINVEQAAPGNYAGNFTIEIEYI